MTSLVTLTDLIIISAIDKRVRNRESERETSADLFCGLNSSKLEFAVGRYSKVCGKYESFAYNTEYFNANSIIREVKPQLSL